MALLIPAPPGFQSGFSDSPPARFLPPSLAGAFVIGTFDRGDFGQISGPSEVAPQVGGRTNSSATIDAINTLLAERVPTVTYARVVGPDAAPATKELTGLTVTAKTAGAWGNNLTVTIEAAGENGAARRIVIKETGTTVAVSPTFDTNADAAAWTAENDVVEVVATAPTLQAVEPAAPLAGGDADLDGITPASYAEAAAKIDARYGPGQILVPGVTSIDVHIALLPYLVPFNRLARFELDVDVTESDAIEHSLALEAEDELAAGSWELFASHAYVLPIAGQPERPVSWATVQAGINTRVFLERGIGPAPYGELRGQGLTVQRLIREWTTLTHPGGEVQRLYAGHVNTAVDRGSTINMEGYRTGSRDELLADGHGAFVRMALRFEGETLARRRIGDPVDRNSVVDYGGDLIAMCQRFVDARAINDDNDAGFIVDVDSVNTQASMDRREIHGLLRYHPTPSADWVDFLVGASRTQEIL